LVLLSDIIVCHHSSVSLTKEKICHEISEDKIAVCKKTQGLRSGNFSDLNSACSKVLVPVKIFQFHDMHYTKVNDIGTRQTAYSGGFFNLKLFLKLSCYHDNTSCLKFSKARVSACMYFLVWPFLPHQIFRQGWATFCKHMASSISFFQL
jgi:hypothetical protein